jgi:hypothetical protein
VPVGARTTTIGGGTALGLARSTARPIAAMLANAARPRQNASRLHQPPLSAGLASPPIRSEMRRQTSPEGCTGAIAAVSGISRSSQARVASRSSGCAGSRLSKRRRAGPRKVPAAYSAARRSASSGRL